MDSEFKAATISQAHPDTMDCLSKTWCNFAVQAFQPQLQENSLVFHTNSTMKMENGAKSPFLKMDTSVTMDDSDNFVPPWKSNDMKSWIWMQQAMHPELNYNSYSKKKWMSWKPLELKKWLKEIKQKSKEEKRLQKAEVHAALSIAGLAAALSAIASENSKDEDSNAAKDSAVASATALVAAQCAKVAEAMGATKEHLSSTLASTMTHATSDIITLTAAATTSLRGAATLKVRSGMKNKLNGSTPVLPIEDNSDLDFDFENSRSLLAKGVQLTVETGDGRCNLRSVSVILNGEAKVILRMRKPNFLNTFARPRESIILVRNVELYKESEARETNTCYPIVLTTNKGMMKLGMMDDYQLYRRWSMTINQMLMLSTSFTKYELQFYKT